MRILLVKHFLVGLLLIAFIHPQAFALQTTEVYETYIAANKLVPILEPLIGPDDKITAFRNKLFIKAPPQVQDEIFAVLEEIDRPLKNIQISLRYGHNTQQQNDHTATDAKVKVFRGSSHSSNIEVEVVNKNRLTTNDSSADQTIRVLEGEQGILNVGEDYPTTQFVYINPLHAGVSQEYQSVGNQIFVTPRRVKDQIRLEITSSNKRMKRGSNDQIEKVEAQTVLVIEAGEWVSLASSSQGTTQSERQITTSTRQVGSQNASLQIRAVIID